MTGAAVPAGTKDAPAPPAYPSLRELAGLAVITAEVMFLALVIRRFNLENPAFSEKVVPLIVVGFVLHHLLPMHRRLPFFVALCFAGIGWVFGPVAGGWLVAIGLVLIGAASVPLPWSGRVALVALLGAVLAVFRVDALAAPFPGAIWPILGSMFCYRMMVFLYEAKHAKTRPGIWQTLAYFFLLPNVTFPLFPVVDFATFRRTYYDRDALAIYQQGVQWIARGVTHLLLYRIVYQRLTLSPSEVTSVATLIQYVIANFLLYLRVSGLFHLTIGLLHLFGFRLPPTHRFFYLASSFTDFWRRINIYWKDFSQKLIFQPVFFPLKRRLGDRGALVVATLLVFVATWALHSYQWFWLLGSWLFSATDAAFWGLLGLILVVALIRESRKGRVRTIGGKGLSWRTSVPAGLSTMLTFTAISLLWAMWTSPTFGTFAALFSGIHWVPSDALLLAGYAAAVTVIGIVGHRLHTGLGESATNPPVIRTTLLAAAPLALALVSIDPRVTRRLPITAQEVLRDMKLAELNRGDQAELQRGYYEKIVGVNRFNSQLWEVFAQRVQERQDLNQTGILRGTGQVDQRVLKPLMGIMYRGVPFSTNRWGMRDKDYGETPAPDTYRIALVGPSFAMGSGVADGETFEALVENGFNAAPPAQWRRYEVLNFAVWGYSPLSQVWMLEHGQVFTLAPRVLLYAGHLEDLLHTGRHVAALIRNGVEIPYPEVREVARKAGLTPGMEVEEAARRTRPFEAELTDWAYRRIVAISRQHNVVPVWVHVPMPMDRPTEGERRRLTQVAANAGFIVMTTDDPYQGHDPRTLIVTPWDRHPNKEGHRLIAAALDRALREQQRSLFSR